MAKFEKGIIPHNKGKKIEEYLSKETIEKIKESQFKAGVHTMENSKSWKGGIQMCKNDCSYILIGTNKRIRRPKMIYEENYGELPKGFVIVHKNGKKHDDNPENLLAISRADLMKLNSNNAPISMEELIEKYSLI